MGLLDIFGKKNTVEMTRQMPYLIKTAFMPYKLRANAKSSATLSVALRNVTKDQLMSSVLVELPKQLSFDEMGLVKNKEVKIGDLGPNQEKESSVEIYGNPGTERGEYTIMVTAYQHYRDYTHVVNSMKKSTTLQVV